MNWDAIGAIAETLGAVGVIASLVIFATQIRHSRAQMTQGQVSEPFQTRSHGQVVLAPHRFVPIWIPPVISPPVLFRTTLLE